METSQFTERAQGNTVWRIQEMHDVEGESVQFTAVPGLYGYLNKYPDFN